MYVMVIARTVLDGSAAQELTRRAGLVLQIRPRGSSRGTELRRIAGVR